MTQEEAMIMFNYLASFGTLSNIQLQILYCRINFFSYRKILDIFKLSCFNSLQTCFRRTCMGRFWVPGFEGGQNSYLSEIDQIIFLRKICEEADNMNCVPTCIACAFAGQLARERIIFAKRFLSLINCPNVINEIQDPGEPSSDYIRNFCSDYDIRIARPQEIEYVRRMSCDVTNVLRFFERNWDLLDRDPRLIFNMDETMLNANRRFKVLALKYRIPLVTSLPNIPHITACVTISAAGKFFDPLIILKDKKTMKNLESYNNCYFGSTKSGWINRRMFLWWSLLFICQLSYYRLMLPKELQNQECLLLLDGHSSRLSYRSMLLFWIFHVDVVLIPGHCTHVLQPFDVGIASPLKVNYKALICKKNFKEGNDNDFHRSAIRDAMISSFIDALHKTCTPGNISSSFAKAGVCPLDPGSPLQSQYVMKEALNVAKENWYSGRMINTMDMLSRLFQQENGRNLTDSDLKMSIYDLQQIVISFHDKNVDGIALSKLPQLFAFNQTNDSIEIFNLE